MGEEKKMAKPVKKRASTRQKKDWAAGYVFIAPCITKSGIF